MQKHTFKAFDTITGNNCANNGQTTAAPFRMGQNWQRFSGSGYVI